MTKALTATDNSKKPSNNAKRLQNFDNRTTADRLRTVSWRCDIHPNGLVKPVYGIPTFPLAATVMQSNGHGTFLFTIQTDFFCAQSEGSFSK